MSYEAIPVPVDSEFEETWAPSIVENAEKHGIELWFPCAPPQEVKDALRALKFRAAKTRDGRWYWWVGRGEVERDTRIWPFLRDLEHGQFEPIEGLTDQSPQKPVYRMRADEVYSQITDKMIAELEKGTVPWRKPWTVGLGIPSYVDERTGLIQRYKGINTFVLAFRAMKSGYSQSLWFTRRKAESVGGKVLDNQVGEVCIKIVKNKMKKKPERTFARGEIIDENIEEESYRWTFSAFEVFNVEQCDLPQDVIDKYIPDLKQIDFDPIESLQTIAEGMPSPPDTVFGGNESCYKPRTDELFLPEPDRFDSPESFYASWFHELAHSTGHSSRLNRSEVMDPITFGSHQYSIEELRAEMATCFLIASAGVESEDLFENSAAYIAAWLEKLKADPRLLIRAATDAQKIVDHILS